MKEPTLTLEIARQLIARRMARVFGLPENLDLETQLEADEHFDALSSWPMALARTTASIMVGKDGAVKVAEHGHALVKESLDQLGDQALANTVRELVATSRLLADMGDEKGKLEDEIPSLRRFVEYEPTLIEHEIKKAFPETTTGKAVTIVSHNRDHELGEHAYELIVNENPAGITVPEKFGQAIAARAKVLDQACSDINTKNNRLGRLKLEIADLHELLPALRQKIQHLAESLDRAELERRLNGEFVGLVLDDQNQPVVLVRREIREELTDIPGELKRQLIARHLAGDKFPENVQKALGIDRAINAVAKATCGFKIVPKPRSTKAKPSARR